MRVKRTVQSKTNKIVITGGPGTGKSSLILALEQREAICFPEVSREIIRQAQADGIGQLFLTDPLLFSEKLLKGRLQQFQEAARQKQASGTAVFFDRGLPDVVAYLHYKQVPYPNHFDQCCRENRYDTVFILPPWKEIYMQDNERYESFEQAEKIYRNLVATYQNFGYQPLEVPKASVEERVRFVLKNVPAN